MTAGAALDEKKVTPATVIFCENGSIQIGKFRIQEDRLPFGYLSVREIVEKSSNVGAVKLGQTMSSSVFYRHLTDFGFGRTTGIVYAAHATHLSTLNIQRPTSKGRGLTRPAVA